MAINGRQAFRSFIRRQILDMIGNKGCAGNERLNSAEAGAEALAAGVSLENHGKDTGTGV